METAVADQTAEQMKRQNIDTMGERLGAQYSELWQEVAHIYIKWGEFVDLVATNPKRIEVLNRAAPMFFRIAQDALWESSLLHIARLTDSANSMGHKAKTNLTIQNFPALIDDPALKSKVTKLIDVALQKSNFCRDWRNRYIAHRDLELALNDSTQALAEANKNHVEAALTAIANVLNAVLAHYTKSETRFDLTPRHNGAVTLLHVLDDGIKAQDKRSERLLAGTPLEEDLAAREL